MPRRLVYEKRSESALLVRSDISLEKLWGTRPKDPNAARQTKPRQPLSYMYLDDKPSALTKRNGNHLML